MKELLKHFFPKCYPSKCSYTPQYFTVQKFYFKCLILCFKEDAFTSTDLIVYKMNKNHRIIEH